MPIERWECEYCEDIFDSEWECEAHEKECEFRPQELKTVENLVSTKCPTCAKYDNLLNYYPPECKMMHEVLPATHCEAYELTSELVDVTAIV